jgi:hypothetical protein
MSIRLASLPLGSAAALLFSLLVAAAEVSAQDRSRPLTVALSGQVIDHETGQPIPFATVQIGAMRIGVLTDSAGRFRLPGVTEGVHVVHVSQLGYVGAEVEWRVVPENPPMLVQLIPSPVVLAGVEAAIDRLAIRRRAYPRSVRVLDRAHLADAVGQNAMDVVRGRGGLAIMPCPGPGANLECILHRGRPVRPAVFIDEHPAHAGLWALANLQPHELHAIEVFGNGRQIRVYTVWFMSGLARRPGALQQIPIW